MQVTRTGPNTYRMQSGTAWIDFIADQYLVGHVIECSELGGQWLNDAGFTEDTTAKMAFFKLRLGFVLQEQKELQHRN